MQSYTQHSIDFHNEEESLERRVKEYELNLEISTEEKNKLQNEITMLVETDSKFLPTHHSGIIKTLKIIFFIYY